MGLRKDADNLAMKQRVNDQVEGCMARVQQAKKRDEKTAAFLEEWKDREVSVLFETAATTSYAAHKQESISQESLEHSVHVLGRHYSTHKQYNLSADDKISSILQGCLHEAPGAPSSRALPPPVPPPYPPSWCGKV